MPIKVVLTPDEHAALDEGARANYDERTDKDGAKSYWAQLEGPDGYAYEDVKGLKSALTREREQYKAANRQLAQMRDKLGDIDVETLQSELETLRAESAASTARLGAALRASAVAAACASAKANPALIEPVVEKRTQVTNGKIVVLDEAGAPTDMTVTQLVNELREDDRYAGAFAGTGNSGGGSSGANGSKGSARSTPSAGPQRRSAMSVQAKCAYISEHGNDAFMNLPY